MLKYYWDSYNKEYKMGREYSTNTGDEKNVGLQDYG
jgi:hypothetical protein